MLAGWASAIHKWLALIIGVQMLVWVASGLFFAVYPIERVRSEHRIAEHADVGLDASALRVYTYDKDSEGQSACSGQCAKNWPPLAAAQGAQASGDWSLVAREDGTQQWAYYGKPLYTFIQDKKPGDKNGDGKMGAWHVAQPDMD